METYKDLQINISGHIGTFQFCEVDFTSDSLHIVIRPEAQIGPIVPRLQSTLEINLPYGDIDGYLQFFSMALSMQTNVYIVHHNSSAPRKIRIIGPRKLKATLQQFGIHAYRAGGLKGFIYKLSPIASVALIAAVVWWFLSTHQ